MRVAIDGNSAREVARHDFDARLRSVEQGPDGAIWIAEDGKRRTGVEAHDESDRGNDRCHCHPDPARGGRTPAMIEAVLDRAFGVDRHARTGLSDPRRKGMPVDHANT